MKLACILIVSIFNLILWSSIKTTPIRKGLAIRAENDYSASKILNDEAESSVIPQTQKDKETLTKNDKYRDNGGDKVFNKSEYDKEYYQNNKEYFQNYQKLNKEKLKVYQQNYYKKNKEKCNEYKRKYRLKKKNAESNNNEGTSFVNPQTANFTNEGKEDQLEVEEPNKILEDATIDLYKKMLPFDLNEMPDNEE
ncbi:unnamed protein product [Meloidogyne enterolobii]|uniref:Uncharacterized protein n=1 Tax=Meloidogyne enterolobii TaxID=390850 RepID=A0ACB0YC60_MELEN